MASTSTEEIIVPNCQGCLNAIEEGAVVAFGDSLFHVKCFICAKCKQCVDSETNLLLLDDGRPVCDNCSYNCAACQKVIKDEAIMTGEKAYHSNCFKCVSCKKTIDDLIFTQTSKGIYCTTCHDLRKAEKLRKKNRPAPLDSQKTLPTPVISRSNSSKTSMSPSEPTAAKTTTTKPAESFLSELSPFTLSFFDNESSELDNLTSSLGANLSIDTNTKKSINSTQSRINRVSEILQSSLRSSSLNQSERREDNELNDLDINKLKQELSESRSRLKEVETNYKTLQDASQQALIEFNKVKEEYEKETAMQQKQELVIASLLKKNGGILSKKEIEKLAQLRIDLERTCRDIIHYRDKILASIDKQGEKHELNTYYSSYQKSLAIQIKSLIAERDLLQHQTKDLKVTRDEVIHDMVLLNTKHSELMTMNNDLSRRAIEKEEFVIPTIQRHTPPPLSPSQSTETFNIPPPRPRRPSDASSIMCKVSSRNSFLSDQTPTLFRIKKKSSTMFGVLGASSSSSTNLNSTAKPNKPEPSLSSSSTSTFGSSGKSSLYANNNFNSSLQSLHLDSSKSLTKNKSFMDSTASLQLTSTHHSGNSNGHSFQPMSFIRPVKCGACGDKIWARSEYRCDGCGFSSHSRCLSKVPQHCIAHGSHSELQNDSSSVFNLSLHNDKPKKSFSDNSMFGSDLSQRVQMENQSVPIIVQECIKAVESRGLDYEGIYRKSGGAAQIRSIQLSFDQGEKIDLCDEEEYNDVCAITSVLKQYFRELPNPLLTYESYSTFIDISSMNPDEKKIKAFAEALAQLPKAHLDTIVLLSQHLQRIYKQSEENRMTVKNLAMVFAPTLMRHSDPSRDFLDISYKNATIEYILLHTSELFSSS